MKQFLLRLWLGKIYLGHFILTAFRMKHNILQMILPIIL